MRILTVILVAAVVGVSVGAAAAYIQANVDLNATSLPPGLPGEERIVERTGGGPQALVEEPHYEFGTMQRGTSRSHHFTIKNVGTAPLKLEVGPASCKCTLSEVDARPIPPGESAQVELKWDAKSDPGPFRQTATILTNDPQQSRIELTIEGDITEATGVSPPELMFDKVSVDDSKTAEVYVMAMHEDDLEVSSAELTNVATRDKFDVQIEPVAREKLPDPAAKDGVRITVTAKPGLPLGRFDQWLSLKTNLPAAEELEIPVYGRVVGDISVYGSAWNEELGLLMLGSVKSSEGKKAKVNVVVRGPDAAGVKFTVRSRDPENLNVTIGEPRKLKETLYHVPVEIEVPAGTPPMVRTDTAQGDAGRIVLETTHPRIKELTLDVRFSVAR